VAEIAYAIAAAMKLGDEEVRAYALGALLHEIGKLDVPDAILFKAARLDDAEMRAMRTHPYLGYERVRGVPSLASAAEIVYADREKFDGSRYSRGLKCETIPPGARIVAVARAFETFVSDRPHDFSRALTHARAEMSRSSGVHFDPAVVEVLLGVSDEVLIPAEVRTAAP
jgi:HD-GYP domain-containing protein (c-di-GMP phosphodiesterase class II)